MNVNKESAEILAGKIIGLIDDYGLLRSSNMSANDMINIKNARRELEELLMEEA